MKDRNKIMTGCLIFIFMMVAGLTVQSVYGTLVDSEDFEAYDTTILTNQSSEWYCGGLYGTTDCSRTIGTPLAGSAGHTVVQESGNKYLSVWATGFKTTSDMRDTDLVWNHTNSSKLSVLGDVNYTVVWKMRLGTYQDDLCNGTNNWRCLAGIALQWGVENNHIVGKQSTCEGDCQLYVRWATGNSIPPLLSSQDSYPDYVTNTTTCTLPDDGQWHIYTAIHFMNVTDGYRKRYVTMYKDGVLCYAKTYLGSPDQYLSTSSFFEEIHFTASGIYSMDFDDIIFYENETVIGSPYECSDSTDNDGDGFTDYPDDPSCTSASDNTEAPYDYVQCNNGIDDDGDGFIDYPDDPSCNNMTDTTESPRDDSPSGEDTCLVEEGCILKDTFPYSDELNLHGWFGDAGSLSIPNIYGSNKIYLDTDSDTVGFNISKNISNPNIYDSVNSDLDFYIDIGGVGILFDDTNYTFYWEHLDADERVVNSLRFDISRVSSVTQDFVKVLLYNYNGTDYEQIGNTIYPAHDSASKIQFFLTFDQILKTYDITYYEYGESGITVTDLPWADVFASKIYTTNLKDINSIDDSKVDVYVDDFNIYTNDISYDSVCDTWALPYYLKESFNGFPMACDWNSNMNLFFTGKYKLSNATPYYYQQIELPDQIKDSQSRYATIKWDAEFDHINGGGSTILRVYDEVNYNFLTVYYLNDLYYFYDNDGTGTLAQSNIPTNETFGYMIVIDMQDDGYDLYYNSTLIVSSAEFTNNFYNLKTISFFKISSAYSDVEIDNLAIYASTDDGTPLIPDEDLIPIIINETTMCGLVYTTQPNCIDDSDCESGFCMVNHKCSRWNANYCTEKGWVFGNKCFLAGTMDCALTGAGNLVINNFFLFLVFLVIVMLAIYLTIMFRRG